MFFSGASLPRFSTGLRSAGLALAATLMLSACVDPITGLPVEGTAAAPEGPAAPPLPKPEDNVYVAKSDGAFQVPALPIEEIPEAYRRQVVEYSTDQAPGTIIIDPSQKVLYYVMGKNKALRYGIAVGKEGFQWSGEAVVAEKKPWPTWTPPKEMIERKPELKEWENGQPGGPTNPLGARAIYLLSNGVDYGYRIHGTPEWKSIGRNASSGCIRMINQDVMDLYERVQGGEKVIVLTASGEMPTGLSIPKPPTVKKKSSPKPAAAAPAPAPVAAPPLVVLPPPTIAGGPGVTPAPTVTPAAAPEPAATPAPAPAATPAPAVAPAPAPVCAVPLVNGLCPQG
jgi:lipoprotein-anchoring transpeptidase ErfK/SrfK